MMNKDFKINRMSFTILLDLLWCKRRLVDEDQDLAWNHQEELKMQQKEEEAQKSNPPKDKYRKYKTFD